MESNMNDKMNDSLTEYICGTMPKGYTPALAISYQDGFKACNDILMPLLIESSIHVFASKRAAGHIPDTYERRPIDVLVERIKAVLPE